MNIKKIVFVFLAMGSLFAGCATNARRYNQASPVENDCTLVLNGSLTGLDPVPHIISFDGTPVNWHGGFGVIIGAIPGENFRIKIPAGEHILIGSLYSLTIDQEGEIDYIDGPELTIAYNFTAGKTYKVEVSIDNIQLIDTTK
jgi:hypothetical protein